MKTSFVQLPLDKYNEILLENYKLNMELDSVVKIEADWNGEPRLTIDLSILAARINKKFEQSEFTDKWTLKDMSKHQETVWDAFKKIEYDEDGEDQA